MEEIKSLIIVDIFMHPSKNQWKPLNSKIICFDSIYGLFTECYGLFIN